MLTASDAQVTAGPELNFRALFEAALDALPQAILVVGAHSVPLFKNAAAGELLNRRDGLLLRGGKLVASGTRAARRLASCLDDLTSNPDADERKGKWLKIERGRGMPYALFATRLRCQAPNPSAKTDPVALVVVLELDREFSIAPNVLEELFGLTRAEARLSCALLRGHRIDSAADLLGVSLSTARTQVRAIFAKLHLTRQQQLVQLLSMLTTVSPTAHR
jgi:DNA-binding CsgD family transcriptional regulator